MWVFSWFLSIHDRAACEPATCDLPRSLAARLREEAEMPEGAFARDGDRKIRKSAPRKEFFDAMHRGFGGKRIVARSDGQHGSLDTRPPLPSRAQPPAPPLQCDVEGKILGQAELPAGEIPSH